MVIGAGMAGLTAGRILADTGFAVTVIEARDRIGGRIWTDDSLGVPCDLGASWIHGVRRNPLTRWCRVLNIPLYRRRGQATWIYRNGRGKHLKEVAWKHRRTVIRAALGYFRTAAPFWVRQFTGRPLSEVSLADVLERMLWEETVPLESGRFLAWLLAVMEAVNGAPARELGLLAGDVPEYWWENAAPIGGFERLVRDAAGGLEIHLNTVARQVFWNAKEVVVETDRGSLEADAVIVTVPVGVLRAGEPGFDPPLPPGKWQALNHVGYGGVLNKVVFRFACKFWPEGRERLGTLPPDVSRRGLFDLWADFSGPAGAPILIGFAGGDTAERLDRGAADQAVARSALDRLEEMFGTRVPEPVALRVTRWLTDPWSRGSYSYGGVADGRHWRSILGEPVENRIYFAGEATDPDHFGTVHAALLSGEREALRIHRRFCCERAVRSRLPWRRA